MVRDVNTNIYLRAYYNKFNYYNTRKEIESLSRFSDNDLKYGLKVMQDNSFIKLKSDRLLYIFSEIVDVLENLNTYKCEKCNTIYYTKEDLKECECFIYEELEK